MDIASPTRSVKNNYCTQVYDRCVGEKKKILTQLSAGSKWRSDVDGRDDFTSLLHLPIASCPPPPPPAPQPHSQRLGCFGLSQHTDTAARTATPCSNTNSNRIHPPENSVWLPAWRGTFSSVFFIKWLHAIHSPSGMHLSVYNCIMNIFINI